MDSYKVPTFSLGTPRLHENLFNAWVELKWTNLNLWRQERNVYVNCHKVWSGKPGAINSLQLKHEGFPFRLPYRRIILKPRSEKWGNFLFLGLNQTAILTTEQNPKGCKSMNKFNPLISCMLLFQEKESAEWGKGQSDNQQMQLPQKYVTLWQSSSKSGDIMKAKLRLVLWPKKTGTNECIFKWRRNKSTAYTHTPVCKLIKWR